jgi:hypothetical protein
MGLGRLKPPTASYDESIDISNVDDQQRNRDFRIKKMYS